MLAAAYLVAMTAWAVALAWFDFREHRLPDRLTLPAIPLAAVAVAWANPESLGFAAMSAVLLGSIGLSAHRMADLGYGDVKLLPSIALLVCNSPEPADNLAKWFVVMAILGGVHAAIHLVITRDRHSHIPFGPSILGGMLVAVISG